MALRPADSAALTAMQSWLVEAINLGAAVFSTGTVSELLSPPSGRAYLAAVEDAPVGYVAVDCAEGLLVITALAVAPRCRNLGLGAEAVFSAERLFPEARCSRALVPLRNGLAVYFWLRIGYRPLFLAHHGVQGVTSMHRDLNGTATRRLGA